MIVAVQQAIRWKAAMRRRLRFADGKYCLTRLFFLYTLVYQSPSGVGLTSEIPHIAFSNIRHTDFLEVRAHYGRSHWEVVPRDVL